MPGLNNIDRGDLPTNLLINGKGKRFDVNLINQYLGTFKSEVLTTQTPLAVFKVVRGKRYRFRLVNSNSMVCASQLEIEGHDMQIIASDSYDLQPVLVSSIVSLPGERYDFVVNANQPGGS